MIQTIVLILVSLLAAHQYRMLFIERMHHFWSTIATDFLLSLQAKGLLTPESDVIDWVYGAIGRPSKNYWKLTRWTLAGFAVNSVHFNLVNNHWKETEHADHTNQGDGQNVTRRAGESLRAGPEGAEDAKAKLRRRQARPAPAQAYRQGAEILGHPMIGVSAIPTPDNFPSTNVIPFHATHHRPFKHR